MSCIIQVTFDTADWDLDDLRNIAGYGKFGLVIECEYDEVQGHLDSVLGLGHNAEVTINKGAENETRMFFTSEGER